MSRSKNIEEYFRKIWIDRNNFPLIIKDELNGKEIGYRQDGSIFLLYGLWLSLQENLSNRNHLTILISFNKSLINYRNCLRDIEFDTSEKEFQQITSNLLNEKNVIFLTMSNYFYNDLDPIKMLEMTENELEKKYESYSTTINDVTILIDGLSLLTHLNCSPFQMETFVRSILRIINKENHQFRSIFTLVTKENEKILPLNSLTNSNIICRAPPKSGERSSEIDGIVLLDRIFNYKIHKKGINFIFMSNLYKTVKHATKYGIARPVYPKELTQTILNYMGISKFNGKIIDFGCGTGQSLRQWIPLSSNILGVDASPAQIEQAKTSGRQYNNLHFKTFDVDKDNIEELTSDNIQLITCGQSFHWFKDKKKFINDITINLLESNGTIAIFCYTMPFLTTDDETLNERLRQLTLNLYKENLKEFVSPNSHKVYLEGMDTNEFKLDSYDNLHKYERHDQISMGIKWSMNEYLNYRRTWSGSHTLLRTKGVEQFNKVFDEADYNFKELLKEDDKKVFQIQSNCVLLLATNKL
ncbi:hypothetical protein SNEBB_008110 [Seison nebaliae]|nr:hypothetical protein SNEBB_008110 [Seison nebaliae]